MHNAAFAALNMDWAYVPLPVAPGADRMREAVVGVRALGLRGANVTVPHKQAVLPWLDDVSDAARTIGAVNTILVAEDGRLLGENTDSLGFSTDLQAHDVDVAGRSAVVMGAGGSARAVVFALAMAGARMVTVLNRSLERGHALVESLSEAAGACELVAGRFPEDVALVGQRADLVVNCTSLGMSPKVDALAWDESVPFRRGQVVYDLVYNPERTALLARAEADRARAVGGLGMLVQQGAAAFTMWTGVAAPVEVMEGAARARMADRG
jgi:shikimate dehydrogenase